MLKKLPGRPRSPGPNRRPPTRRPAGRHQRADRLRRHRVEQSRERDERLRGRERIAERVMGRLGRLPEHARRAVRARSPRARTRRGGAATPAPAPRCPRPPAAARAGAANWRSRKLRSIAAVWNTGTRPASSSSMRSIASSSGGASARSGTRSLCTSTAPCWERRVVRTSVYMPPPSTIRPSSIGTAPIAMISSRRGSSPVISRSSAHQRASRHGVSSAGRSACGELGRDALGGDRRSLTPQPLIRAASAAPTSPPGTRPAGCPASAG